MSRQDSWARRVQKKAEAGPPLPFYLFTVLSTLGSALVYTDAEAWEEASVRIFQGSDLEPEEGAGKGLGNLWAVNLAQTCVVGLLAAWMSAREGKLSEAKVLLEKTAGDAENGTVQQQKLILTSKISFYSQTLDAVAFATMTGWDFVIRATVVTTTIAQRGLLVAAEVLLAILWTAGWAALRVYMLKQSQHSDQNDEGDDLESSPLLDTAETATGQHSNSHSHQKVVAAAKQSGKYAEQLFSTTSSLVMTFLASSIGWLIAISAYEYHIFVLGEYGLDEEHKPMAFLAVMWGSVFLTISAYIGALFFKGEKDPKKDVRDPQTAGESIGRELHKLFYSLLEYFGMSYLGDSLVLTIQIGGNGWGNPNATVGDDAVIKTFAVASAFFFCFVLVALSVLSWYQKRAAAEGSFSHVLSRFFRMCLLYSSGFAFHGLISTILEAKVTKSTNVTTAWLAYSLSAMLGATALLLASFKVLGMSKRPASARPEDGSCT